MRDHEIDRLNDRILALLYSVDKEYDNFTFIFQNAKISRTPEKRCASKPNPRMADLAILRP